MNLLEIKNYNRLKKRIPISKLEKMTAEEIHAEYLNDLKYDALINKETKKENRDKKIAPVKKVAKRVMKTLAGITLTASAVLGGVNVKNSLDTKNTHNYKSQQQITLDAKEFGAELGLTKSMSTVYRTKNILRLSHNNGDPIRVYIDDSFNVEYKNLIFKTLNYMEETFKDINDNYFFKVVDRQEYNFHKLTGQTVLEYVNNTATKTSTIGGTFSPNFYILSGNFIKNGIINVNSTLLDKYFEEGKITNQKEYILIHELVHFFGIGDNLSKITAKHYNSILNNNSFSNTYNKLFPNDYKTLHALYNVNHIENSEINVFEKNKILEKINQFEKEFYIENVRFHVGNDFSKLQTIDKEKLNEISLNNLSIFSSHNAVYQTKITFDNDKYSYIIKDLNDNIIENFTGNYLYNDTHLVFDNLTYSNSHYWRYDDHSKQKAITSKVLINVDGTYYLNEIPRLGVTQGIVVEKDKDYNLSESYDFERLKSEFLYPKNEMTR